MPVKPDIHQAILATPNIDMDNVVRFDLAPTVQLQRGMGGVWEDSGVHAIATLEQTTDKSFTTCSTPALATNTLGAKVGLIGFKCALEVRISCTGLSHTNTNTNTDTDTDTDTLVDGAANRKPGLFSRTGNCRIYGKQMHNLSKLGLVDFRTTVVPFKKLS